MSPLEPEGCALQIRQCVAFGIRLTQRDLCFLIQINSKRAGPDHPFLEVQGVFAMPLESILFLCFVVGALTLFAIVLAYADWVSRSVMQDAVPFVSPSVDTGEVQAHVRRTKSIVYEEVK